MEAVAVKCKEEGCSEATSGKSSYCRVHKKEHRQAWKKMVSEKSEAKKARDQEFAAIHEKAHAAGTFAATVHTPEPMVVQEHENMLDDSSPVKKSYFVAEGLCGFAWVLVRPGTCAFARWMRKHLGTRKAYHGGESYWVSDFGQSVERKERYARAYADVLKKHGIDAYANSRLD